MEKQELTAKLLQGSYLLHRMEADIQQMVSMIIGYARKASLSHSKDYVSAEKISTSCEWRMEAKRKGMFHQISVRCRIIASYESMTTGYSSDGSMSLPQEYVQTVHEDLHRFVEMMVAAYPNIEKAWKPLLDVADHK